MAINDISSPETMAHLFKYDSVHRTYSRKRTCSSPLVNNIS
ncbi:hypothetical protein N9Y26_00730 [bacterium]|nr:hypothetical protein [bacterium]